MKVIDLTSQRFGRLTVLKRAENSKRGFARWLCRCDCGTEKIVRASHLKGGLILSCRCYMVEHNTKHGQASRTGRTTSEYHAWQAAKDRCFNPKHHNYKDYGGRGITMCPEWRDSFEAFFACVGPRPSGLTLDRFPNNDGHYEPGNVRWATWKEQANNKRRTTAFGW